MDTCEYFQELLSRSWDEALSPEEQESLQAHLSQCPQCREVEEQLAQLRQALEEWEEQNVPEGFAHSVMERVRRLEAGKKLLPFRRPLARTLASLAACALLCLGLWRLAPSKGAADAPMTLAVGGEPTAQVALPESQEFDGQAAPRAYTYFSDNFDSAAEDGPLTEEPLANDIAKPASDLACSQLLESASDALGTTPGTLFVLNALPEGLEPEGSRSTTQEGWTILQLEEPVSETVYQELADTAFLMLCQGEGPAAVLLLD